MSTTMHTTVEIRLHCKRCGLSLDADTAYDNDVEVVPCCKCMRDLSELDELRRIYREITKVTDKITVDIKNKKIKVEDGNDC